MFLPVAAKSHFDLSLRLSQAADASLLSSPPFSYDAGYFY
jgi:hypothetical protein